MNRENEKFFKKLGEDTVLKFEFKSEGVLFFKTACPVLKLDDGPEHPYYMEYTVEVFDEPYFEYHCYQTVKDMFRFARIFSIKEYFLGCDEAAWSYTKKFDEHFPNAGDIDSFIWEFQNSKKVVTLANIKTYIKSENIKQPFTDQEIQEYIDSDMHGEILEIHN